MDEMISSHVCLRGMGPSLSCAWFGDTKKWDHASDGGNHPLVPLSLFSSFLSSSCNCSRPHSMAPTAGGCTLRWWWLGLLVRSSALAIRSRSPPSLHPCLHTGVCHPLVCPRLGLQCLLDCSKTGSIPQVKHKYNDSPVWYDLLKVKDIFAWKKGYS
jgi:hypothetical protein